MVTRRDRRPSDRCSLSYTLEICHKVGIRDARCAPFVGVVNRHPTRASTWSTWDACQHQFEEPECPLMPPDRSEEHTSELQSLMRISYAVFCLKKKIKKSNNTTIIHY